MPSSRYDGLACFLLLLCAACAQQEATPPAEPISLPASSPGVGVLMHGEEAIPVPVMPDFALATTAGDTLHAVAFRGQVLLLYFWTAWCLPCRDQLTTLNVLQATLYDSGLSVLGISLDESGPEVLPALMAQHALRYPVAWDDGTLAAQFGGIYGLPTTFVVDTSGTVVNRITGPIPVAILWQRLLALLSLPYTTARPAFPPMGEDAETHQAP